MLSELAGTQPAQEQQADQFSSVHASRWLWTGVRREKAVEPWPSQDSFTPGSLALDFTALIHVQLLERELWEEGRNWQLLEYSTHCDQQQ